MKVVYIELRGKHCGGYFWFHVKHVFVLKLIGSSEFTCPHMAKAGDVARICTRRWHQ